MPTEITGAQLVLSFIILIIISSFTAIFADRRGRNPIIWFVYALLFSFLATIVLFILPPLNKNEEENTPPSPPIPPTKNSLEKSYSNGNKFLEQDRLWYYLDSTHTQFGPLSIIGLRELWNRGNLKLNSYVWTEGMTEWKKVEQIPELHHALKEMKEFL